MPELPAWLHRGLFVIIGFAQSLSLYYFYYKQNMAGLVISSAVIMGSLIIFTLQEGRP